MRAKINKSCTAVISVLSWRTIEITDNRARTIYLHVYSHNFFKVYSTTDKTWQLNVNNKLINVHFDFFWSTKLYCHSWFIFKLSFNANNLNSPYFAIKYNGITSICYYVINFPFLLTFDASSAEANEMSPILGKAQFLIPLVRLENEKYGSRDSL